MDAPRKTGGPRAEELLKALDWLALNPKDRKGKPEPNLTALTEDERRVMLRAVQAHECRVAVPDEASSAAQSPDLAAAVGILSRIHAAGVPVVEMLLREESGERVRARFGLDDGAEQLRALAEACSGDLSRMFGPLLLDSVVVRCEFDESWRRAHMGSAEDIALMVAIGSALVGMKRRRVSANLTAEEKIVEARLCALDHLLPRPEREARRYADHAFLRERIPELARAGQKENERLLSWVYNRPEVVELLLRARAEHRGHTAPLPYRRLAREFVRPFASRDPVKAKRDIDAERKRRERRG